MSNHFFFQFSVFEGPDPWYALAHTPIGSPNSFPITLRMWETFNLNHYSSSSRNYYSTNHFQESRVPMLTGPTPHGFPRSLRYRSSNVGKRLSNRWKEEISILRHLRQSGIRTSWKLSSCKSFGSSTSECQLQRFQLPKGTKRRTGRLQLPRINARKSKNDQFEKNETSERSRCTVPPIERPAEHCHAAASSCEPPDTSTVERALNRQPSHPKDS